MEWEELIPSAAGPPPEAEPDAGASRGGFARLRERLAKSRQALRAELSASLFDRLDEETWERLEEALILADVGAKATAEVVGRLEAEVEAGAVSGPGGDPRAAGRAARRARRRASRRGSTSAAKPTVIMVVGVNGTGKTTTIGKLAAVLRERFGLEVIVAAADTYRAAAIEQLETWAERAGTEIVTRQPRRRPRRGRLRRDRRRRGARRRRRHRRHRRAPAHARQPDGGAGEGAPGRRASASTGAPHETLIVIDATTGQNGLRQARAFADAVDVSGVVLTKLDGTAKGGIALAIAGELGIPVKLIGVGEGIEDLRPFDAEEFARGAARRVASTGRCSTSSQTAFRRRSPTFARAAS